MPIRILLVDDHETVREGLKSIIGRQKDMTVVAEAADGRAAVEQGRRTQPDVVLMDISMPSMNGVKATQEILRSCPEAKILAFTRHDDFGSLQQLLHAGVSGYVLKQSRSSELLHAIRAVGAGRKYLDSAVAGTVITDFTGRSPRTPGASGKLSAREEETLRLVARGLSNKEIALELSLSVKTIETHKANAMQKFGFHSRMDVVNFAILQGWLKSE